MSNEQAGKARDAALSGALTQIERQFGKGSVMKMGDEGAKVSVEAIPTGALSLDLALGIGGLPRGRIVEVYGPESSASGPVIISPATSSVRLRIAASSLSQTSGLFLRYSLAFSRPWPMRTLS